MEEESESVLEEGADETELAVEEAPSERLRRVSVSFQHDPLMAMTREDRALTRRRVEPIKKERDGRLTLTCNSTADYPWMRWKVSLSAGARAQPGL